MTVNISKKKEMCPSDIFFVCIFDIYFDKYVFEMHV